MLCGYGEPMLHKDIYQISRKLAEAAFVEIADPIIKLLEILLKNIFKINLSLK